MKKLLLLLLFMPLLCTSQSIYYDLSRMDKKELRIARNTIYAKHGRTFKSNNLVKYFNSTLWYKADPNYSDKMLSQQDLDLISVIKCWETDNALIWSKKIDLNNDNIIDYVFLLQYTERNLFLIINNQFIEFEVPYVNDYDYDYADEGYFGIDSIYFHDLKYSLSGTEVLNVRLYDYNDYGMGVIDYLFSYYNNDIVLTRLDGGNSLNLLNDTQDNKSYFVHETGFCEWVHKDYYEYDNGKFILFKEENYEIEATEHELMDMGRPCAACFISGSKVSKNKSSFILIEDLNIGDTILSFDTKTNEYYNSVVLDLVSVDHSNLVELYFDHDTITSTTDHPYFVFDKGWSSFDSLSTQINYNNYNIVNQIQINDAFISITGKKSELKGYFFKNQLRKTFTITKLDKGNTFFLNGVLVGIEEIPPYYSIYFKK